MNTQRGALPILALLVIIGVLGVGGYAYQKDIGGVREKFSVLFAADAPDEVLAKAFENFSQARSFRFSGEISGSTNKPIFAGIRAFFLEFRDVLFFCRNSSL